MTDNVQIHRTRDRFVTFAVFPEPHRTDKAREIGLSVKELKPAANHVRCNTRVFVSKVDRASRALNAGLRRGDVIETVNRRPVSTAAEFEKALFDYQNQPLLLLIRRGRQKKFPVIGRK